jgi:hypothetical protein
MDGLSIVEDGMNEGALEGISDGMSMTLRDNEEVNENDGANDLDGA